MPSGPAAFDKPRAANKAVTYKGSFVSPAVRGPADSGTCASRPGWYRRYPLSSLRPHRVDDESVEDGVLEFFVDGASAYDPGLRFDLLFDSLGRPFRFGDLQVVATDDAVDGRADVGEVALDDQLPLDVLVDRILDP